MSIAHRPIRLITLAEYIALPRKIAPDVRGYCANKSCVVRHVYLDTRGEPVQGSLTCNACRKPLKFIRFRSRAERFCLSGGIDANVTIMADPSEHI